MNPEQIELEAYNRAFWQLGLRWSWDEATFSALRAIECPTERLARYLQTHHPHLLSAYDPKSRAEAVQAYKQPLGRSGAEGASSAPCNWAAACAGQTGA
jgi:hypothetical protein